MGRKNAARADDDSVSYRATRDLLQARQYAQLAEILRQARVASEQRDDQTTAQVLAMAHRLCLACSQCRIEVEWYQQAQSDAGRQERDLRRRLRTVLDLLREIEVPQADEALSAILSEVLERPQHDILTPSARPGLWRRIRAFLVHHFRLPGVQSQEPRPSIGPSHSDIEEGIAVSDTGTYPSERIEGVKPVSPAAEQIDPLDAETGLDPPLTGESKPPLHRPVTPQAESMPPPFVAQEYETEQETPTFLVFCLGAFRLYHNDRPITDWSSLKARSIFKYLVTHRETAVVKDVLMDLFWPEADPGSARRNLHQAIYILRQTLRQGESDFCHVQFQNDCYLLNPELDIWLDSEAFETHVERGRRLEAQGRIEEAIAQYGAAETLYEGDFLEEDPYEDWPAPRRTHLRAMYLETSNRLSAFYARRGQYTTAIALCHRTLTRDRCCEASHRRLIECHLARGQRHLAARQYQSCVQALEDELGLSPSEETEALYRRTVGDAST